MCEVKGYYHLYLEKYSCEHKGCENTLQKKVQIRFIFQTSSSISPNFHVVCLQPNAWLESYGRYGSFGTLIWGSLIVSPVLWLLSSRNTLSATHSDTASYTDPSLRGEVYSNINSGVLELKLHKVQFANKFSGAELASFELTFGWVLYMSTQTIKGTKVAEYSQLSTKDWERNKLYFIPSIVFLTETS